MFYIYILYSLSSDIYYVGHSGDVAKRFLQNNELSEDSFTCKHRPWELRAAFCVGPDRAVAMRLERFIKNQKSRKLIALLIQADFVPNGGRAEKRGFQTNELETLFSFAQNLHKRGLYFNFLLFFSFLHLHAVN